MSAPADAAPAGTTAEVLQRFNTVFLTREPALLADLVADDCVLENSSPAPDGSRHVGQKACVALWTGIATAPGTSFELEELIVAGELGVIPWRYRFGPGANDSVRGVNVMWVHDGRIVRALGYVKGS